MKKLTLAIAVFTVLVLATSAGAVEVNDMFAGRIAISGANGSVTGSNVDATLEPGEPCHVYLPLFGYPGYGSNSIWWTWEAPSTAIYGFDSRDSESNVFVSVYTGDNLTNLTKVINFVGQVPLYATNGITYQIAVTGVDATSTGQVVLNYYEAEVSPWIIEGLESNSQVVGIAAPNGSLASLYVKEVFYAEGRTNQYGGVIEANYKTEFYPQSGVTIKDKKGNVIVKDATPPGAGTQFNIAAFDGKILLIYDLSNSRLIAYKVKNGLVQLNEQPIVMDSFFGEFQINGSEILVYHGQVQFIPPAYATGVTAFDIKLKKEKWSIPVQPGLILSHNIRKRLNSRETDETYKLNIHFFKKGKTLAEHNVSLPTRGQVVYCTDGKGGLLYWTRKPHSSSYINSSLSYVTGKGELVFNNKTLADSGVTWDYADYSVNNLYTAVRNGASATLRAYKINKEMKKIGEANIINYSGSTFNGKKLMVYQRLANQKGFTIYNSKLKKKWTEPIAPGSLTDLGKGVFVREVITPGAGSTNHHFKIFNKKKIIAEHDLTY